MNTTIVQQGPPTVNALDQHWYVYKSSPMTGYVLYGYYVTQESAERDAARLRKSYPLVVVVARWE